MSIIATSANYWIGQNALSISLNALGEANRIQCSVASGAAILCYIRGVKAAGSEEEEGDDYSMNGDGLEYDNGHNYRRWPLTISSTFFNSDTKKYVYVAIPRTAVVGSTAMVVFPSEKLDIWGRSETETADDETGESVTSYEQIGSADYFYIWLQGVISEVKDSDSNPHREWTERMETGTLSTDEAISSDETSWYRWDPVTQTVTFLKEIWMDAASSFRNLRARLLILGGHTFRGVAIRGETPEDSEDTIVTPAYLEGLSGDKYLRKDQDDYTPYSLGVGGDMTVDGLLKALNARINHIESTNFNGSGIFNEGWLLTNSHNGHSYMEVDELLVRMKATFMELEIRKETYSGGNVFYSPAGSVIYRVEYYNSDDERLGMVEQDVKVPFTVGGKMAFLSKLTQRLGILSRKKKIMVQGPVNLSEVAYFRCYLLADDGTTQTRNWWHENDQARCQTFNRASSKDTTSSSDQPDISYDESYVPTDMKHRDGNRFFWRLVVHTGSTKLSDGKWYDYVDLSNVNDGSSQNGFVSGSDAPVAGDSIVCVGNRVEEERMNVIVLEVIGSDAPAIKIYRGVNTFSMSGKKFMQVAPKKIQLRSDSIEWITDAGEPVPPIVYIGVWDSRRRYHYYEEVTHDGSMWLCKTADGYHWESAVGEAVVNEAVAQITGIVADFGTFEYYRRDDVAYNERYTKKGSYNGTAVYYIRNYTTLEPTGANSSSWQKVTSAGSDGLPGSFKSVVFCRTNKDISRVNVTGGSYSNAIPDDLTVDGETIEWHDGIPGGDKMVWSTVNTFYGDGTDEGWAPPTKVMDTEDYDVEFALEQANGATPAPPTDANRHGGSGTQVWFDPILDAGDNNIPGTSTWADMVWRAERIRENGVYGQWVITRIKGEKGDTGTVDIDGIEDIIDGYLAALGDNLTITINPPTLFLNQDTEGQVNFTNASAEVSIYKDGAPVAFAFNGVSAYGYDANGVRQLMAGCATSSMATGTNVGTISLTGITNDTITANGVTQYDYAYDRGIIYFNVVVNSKSYLLSVSWFLNRLGQRITKAYGDFEGTYMSRTEYSQIDARNLLSGTVEPEVASSTPTTSNWGKRSSGSGTLGFYSIVSAVASPAAGFTKAFRIELNGSGVYAKWYQRGEYWSKNVAYKFTAYVRMIPGESGTVSLRISVNDGAERFVKTIEGIGSSWTAINVPFVLGGESELGSNVYFEMGIYGNGSLDIIAPCLTYSDYGVIKTDYEGKIETRASGLDLQFSQRINDVTNNRIAPLETNVSNLEITAQGLTSSVEKVSGSIDSNLLDCADGAGWEPYEEEDTVSYNDSIQKIWTDKQYCDVSSTAVYLKYNRKYVFSVYAPQQPTLKYGFCGASPNVAYRSTSPSSIAVIGAVSGDVYQGCNRYYGTFTAPSTGFYKLNMYNSAYFFRPMLEVGSTPTSWTAGIVRLRSQIKQTEDRISLTVSDLKEGLSDTGIDIINKKIEMTADDFILRNNSGATTLGVDGEGNVQMTGTVKARNLYHGVCLVTEGGIYSSNWYYFKRTSNLDETYAPFTSGSFYTASQIRSMTNGVISNPAGDSSGAFTRCTYDADIVIIIPNNSNTGQGGANVYIPYPVIFDGKIVTIYNRSTKNNTINVVNGSQCIVGIIYYKTDEGKYTDSNPDSSITIAGRTSITLYSMYVGGIPRWVKIEERDI